MNDERADSARPAGLGRRRPVLLRPGEPALWLLVTTLAVTGVMTLVQQDVFRRLSPSGWVLSWVLVAVYALPVMLVAYALDLYEREPVSLIVASLLWGAIAATTLAGLANDGWGVVVARLGGPAFASRWTAALTAPWVEEILKAAGVVLLYLIARDALDDVLDGFVLGAVCGLGFAVVEDVFYFMSIFGGEPSGVLQGFVVRVVASGLYGHVLYTGLAGMAIACFFSGRPRSVRLPVAGLLAGAAVLPHFLWNSPFLDLFPEGGSGGPDGIAVTVAIAVKAMPLAAFVALAVALVRRRDRGWLRVALEPEVDLGGLSPAELARLESPARRRRARRAMRARAGPRAARLLGRLQRAQIDLAVVKARASGEEDARLGRQRAYCKSLRGALAAMPGAAPAG